MEKMTEVESSQVSKALMGSVEKGDSFWAFLDEEVGNEDDDLSAGATIGSFEEAGIPTTDAGFVLSIGSRKFQVTIIRSG